MFHALILNNLQMKCHCFVLVKLVFGTCLFDSKYTGFDVSFRLVALKIHLMT